MTNELDKTAGAYNPDIIYNFDNQIILNWYAQRVISKFSKNMKVLDLGLGHGITANTFSEYFVEYTILDGSPEIIKKYNEEHPQSTVNIIETYFEDYVTNEKYDLIIMGFVLEHVADPLLIMNHYKHFLKPNGKIIIAVPNAEAMNRRLGKYAGLLDDLEVLSDHDYHLGHVRYYTVKKMKEDIEKCELLLKNIEGIYLKPFTTKQIISLKFGDDIFKALCQLGMIYPELCLSILFEVEL